MNYEKKLIFVILVIVSVLVSGCASGTEGPSIDEAKKSVKNTMNTGLFSTMRCGDVEVSSFEIIERQSEEVELGITIYPIVVEFHYKCNKGRLAGSERTVTERYGFYVNDKDEWEAIKDDRYQP